MGHRNALQLKTAAVGVSREPQDPAGQRQHFDHDRERLRRVGLWIVNAAQGARDTLRRAIRHHQQTPTRAPHTAVRTRRHRRPPGHTPRAAVDNLFLPLKRYPGGFYPESDHPASSVGMREPVNLARLVSLSLLQDTVRTSRLTENSGLEPGEDAPVVDPPVPTVDNDTVDIAPEEHQGAESHQDHETH